MRFSVQFCEMIIRKTERVRYRDCKHCRNTDPGVCYLRFSFSVTDDRLVDLFLINGDKAGQIKHFFFSANIKLCETTTKQALHLNSSTFHQPPIITGEKPNLAITCQTHLYNLEMNPILTYVMLFCNKATDRADTF